MLPVLRLWSRCVMQWTVSAWPAVRVQRTAQPCQWPTSNARCYGNATGWADSTSTLHLIAWEGFAFCSSPPHFLLLFLTHLQFLWYFFGELLSWFGFFGLRLIQYFCSRSRLSWGQITGCYNCFRLPVCVVRTGDGPSVLQGPSCHLYPVAILLVTSHLLVLWLILSLVLLVDQWRWCPKAFYFQFEYIFTLTDHRGENKIIIEKRKKYSCFCWCGFSPRFMNTWMIWLSTVEKCQTLWI